MGRPLLLLRHESPAFLKREAPTGGFDENTAMSFTGQRYDFRDQAGDYARLADELAGLLSGESDFVANAANTAALLFDALPDLNWAGFYFLKNGELVVGPFQGKPACVRIALGRGVCGTAAVERKTIIVPDVNAFPGHIACDAASRSEIVVPLISGTDLLGVLDLDSPRIARFDSGDARGLERLAAIFLDHVRPKG
jgi:L-methionine (R)-S-oxide reductase